jgi:hypothetical protein
VKTFEIIFWSLLLAAAIFGLGYYLMPFVDRAMRRRKIKQAVRDTVKGIENEKRLLQREWNEWASPQAFKAAVDKAAIEYAKTLSDDCRPRTPGSSRRDSVIL